MGQFYYLIHRIRNQHLAVVLIDMDIVHLVAVREYMDLGFVDLWLALLQHSNNRVVLWKKRFRMNKKQEEGGNKKNNN